MENNYIHGSLPDSQGLPKTLKDAILLTVEQTVEKVLAAEARPKDSRVILSTEELATYLKVDKQTITRWRNKNRIPYFKIGKFFRYDVNLVIQELSPKKGGKL